MRALVSAVHICVIEASSYTRRSPACAHTADSETTKLAGSISREGGRAQRCSAVGSNGILPLGNRLALL